jgi:hypothetical protein
MSEPLTTEMEKLSLLASSIDFPDDPMLASLLLKSPNSDPNPVRECRHFHMRSEREHQIKTGDSRICFCGAVQDPSKLCMILPENWNKLKDFIEKMQ